MVNKVWQKAKQQKENTRERNSECYQQAHSKLTASSQQKGICERKVHQREYGEGYHQERISILGSLLPQLGARQ
jgi:hypothetical protein